MTELANGAVHLVEAALQHDLDVGQVGRVQVRRGYDGGIGDQYGKLPERGCGEMPRRRAPSPVRSGSLRSQGASLLA